MSEIIQRIPFESKLHIVFVQKLQKKYLSKTAFDFKNNPRASSCYFSKINGHEMVEIPELNSTSEKNCLVVFFEAKF